MRCAATLVASNSFTPQEYEAFVRDHYSGNKTKAQKLMMDDIPETFVQRQLNDSRYISRLVLGLLSHLVRDEDEVDAISRHVIPCTGAITDKLKKDWGLNDVWNSLVTPRFERMNRLTNSDHYGYWDNKDGKRVFQTTMPLDEQRGFSKKRCCTIIDNVGLYRSFGLPSADRDWGVYFLGNEELGIGGR